MHRLFQAFAVQPHRTRTFKLSTDPFFVERVRDIVGLYLNPPDHTLVLCVDEKGQIQALNRTQLVLSMAWGMSRASHTITFATGRLRCSRPRISRRTWCLPNVSRATAIRSFWHFSVARTPASPRNLDVHLIVDNYATHKHARVRTWLAGRPRYHVHYTPTYSSWLNQVERWFGLITQWAIRRGSFGGVPELVEKIDSFVQHYNRSRRPFVWTATADSILAKVARLCSCISGTRHLGGSGNTSFRAPPNRLMTRLRTARNRPCPIRTHFIDIRKGGQLRVVRTGTRYRQNRNNEHNGQLFSVCQLDLGSSADLVQAEESKCR